MALHRPSQLVMAEKHSCVFAHVAHSSSCMHFTAHKVTQTKQTLLPREPHSCITSLW